MIFLRGRWKKKPRPWGPISAVRDSIFRNCDRLGIPVPIFFVIPGGGWRHEIMSGNSPIVRASWNGRTPDGPAMLVNSTDSHMSWYPSSKFYELTNEYTVAFHARIDGFNGSWAKAICVPYYSGNSWEPPYVSFNFGRYNSDTSSTIHEVAYNGNSTRVYYDSTYGIYSDFGNFHKIGYSRNDNIHQWYKDGAYESNLTTSADNSAANIDWGQKNPVHILGATPPSENMDGACSLTVIWNKQLTDDQYFTFDENPYALVEPTPITFFSIPTTVAYSRNCLKWLI